ncbi:DUF5919 domain-containing protein [Microbispora rosea]|uniref:DUF5919 domain-containing protein n=1 Tax=Microbispora rosea TaxID=58117 RepID=UPI003D92DDCC
MKRNKLFRLLVSIFLVPWGMILLLLAGESPKGILALVSGLGVSFVVAGTVSAFREIAIVRTESEDAAEDIANRLQTRLQQPPPLGLRLVSQQRRGYDGYYSWAISTEPCELFCAGRSVLHRIDADFAARKFAPVEQVMLRKLQEGSVIRILFLDPRSDLVSRLAREEGQNEQQLLSDLATSLDICERLYALLKEANLPPRAELHIRVYDQVPYFAYHRDNELVIVGFYFATALGSSSAAFEVTDLESQNRFEGHFTSIFERSHSTRILEEVSSQRAVPFMNHALVRDIRATLEKGAN